MNKRLQIVALVGSLVFPGLVMTQEQQQGPPPTRGPVYSSTSSVDTQGIKNYVLGPGDVLDVRVFGQTDLNSIVEVDSDGNITSLPFLEAPIPAKCRNEKDVQKDIATAFSKYLKNPQVSVLIADKRSRPPATIFGAVRQPARVMMQRKVRLNELLAQSGGFSDRAAGTIQILHTEPIMCPEPGEENEAAPIDGTAVPFEVVRIAELKAGKPEANPVIRPGDYVLVTEAEPVYITGSVLYPQGIFLTEHMTLSLALAMAGGVRKEAKSSDVRIYRQKDGAQTQEIRVDYSAIKRNKIPDVLLQPYDVIDVPEAGLFSSGRIGSTLLGAATGGLTSVFNSVGPHALPQRTIR